jgi:Tol biopolymer transport system component
VAGKPAPLNDAVAFESDAQISPDGHWLAYISAETGKNEAYLQPYPGRGGKELVSTGGADSVRWSHDGRELFYLIRNGEGALMVVEVQTKPQLHIGLPVILAKNLFGTTWDPAPDGKHLLVELIPGLAGSNRTVRAVSDWFEELRRRVPIRR